jgi:hypothetical protein
MRIGDTAQKLAIGGCCLFALSLALPAVEVTVLQEPEAVPGWQAVATLVGLSLYGGAIRDPWLLIPTLAAVGNIVFLLAPWMVSQTRERKTVRVYAVCVVIVFALAVASPFAFEHIQTLLVGYFLWLMSYLLLLGALGARAVRATPGTISHEA